MFDKIRLYAARALFAPIAVTRLGLGVLVAGVAAKGAGFATCGFRQFGSTTLSCHAGPAP